MGATITLPESKRLIILEASIEVGKNAWKAAGEALIEIRDSELYRADHATFWDYCEKRWGWKRRNVETVIQSSTIFKALPVATQNFAQDISASGVRELAKIPAPDRPAVIEAAAQSAADESRPMTAKDIKQAAAQPVEVVEPEPTEPPTNDSKWLKAVGLTDARYLWAVQIEDIASAAIEGATVTQLQAAKLACEVAIKQISRRIKKIQLEAGV